MSLASRTALRSSLSGFVTCHVCTREIHPACATTVCAKTVCGFCVQQGYDRVKTPRKTAQERKE